ncbi:CCA tRNA nucleotidyltransferase [Cytobacillus purgationiresistens]|uniref:CCA-adding enzyme n=1 Tax=Cytobacillus purgationiresistens TaxID=863449 RepID=A0ABU0ALZ2_9BACI|nr:CCA tRNA nucleotidyltransferase [Cytobacillus purgationiresistens]MDQ0271055.1 tRNA nucleotidyltransferase (CCA-adding enzyme) [Cytobacillus purgationiresistens]
MNMTFQKATPILQNLEQAGYEAYFVGGSVRDSILGKDIADIDIATSATPEEIKTIFDRTIDVGIEHGTIIVLYEGVPYEVTTFRTESEYVDYRRPSEVQFIRSLDEDLQRRDFTMNAIALNKDGRFIDPYGGVQAIKDKIIQTVGKAEERFTEDALRMMRALRFHSQLQFEIEIHTYEALKTKGSLLTHIAVERKLAEFNKLLIGRNRKRALKCLTETGLYLYLPDLSSRLDQLLKLEKYDYTELSLEEMWVLLLQVFEMTEDGRKAFLRSWRLPGKKAKYINQLSEWLEYRLTAKFNHISLYQAGEQAAISANRLYEVITGQKSDQQAYELTAAYGQLPITDRSHLNVSGNDLIHWFNLPAGPWIKEELDRVEKAVVTREIENTKHAIREWLL